MSKPPHYTVRHVSYENGHDTNCTLCPDRKKPDQAVPVPKKKRELMLRRAVLAYDERIPKKAEWIVAQSWLSPDVLPVSPEFAHLGGYERADQYLIEKAIEQHEFLRDCRRSFSLVPCARCGKELSLWEWREVIEGEGTELERIMGYFSNALDAEHDAYRRNAQTEENRRRLDSQGNSI